jgi:hypothetical protein
MKCPKFTEAGKPCTLPIHHPNFCSNDPRPVPVMTKAGAEARALVDQYQHATPIMQRDPKCKGCKGRAYNEPPKFDREDDTNPLRRPLPYSTCAVCGGFIYTLEAARIVYATQRAKDTPYEGRTAQWPSAAPKTVTGQLESPDLTAARKAEQQRRANIRNAELEASRPKPAPRDYLAEARAQADKAVNAMLQWNGY